MPYEVLKRNQEAELHDLIAFVYHNVPYYHNLFKQLDLKPEDIQTAEDLQKLPILTKRIIRANQTEFIPRNPAKYKYIEGITGGSTGPSLHYRLSVDDEILSIAMFYANWGYAGYELGDKVAILAGSQLLPSTKSDLIKKIKGFILNHRYFSSLDMTEKYLEKIVRNLNRYKPQYLRGYASAIYAFARYIKYKNIQLDFKLCGVFTTSDVLFDHQREVIEDVFGCKVFDQYSLNDGGVSAYECERHKGLHVDMIRSIMELVDKDGAQIGVNTEGRILATSLHNYAMPFIRYDTGDLGIWSDEKCDCGRELPLLKKVVGRTTDVLEFSNNTVVSGAAVVDMLKHFSNGVQEYQVIQNKKDGILIKIVKDTPYTEEDSKLIIKAFQSHVGKDITINIDFVDRVQTTKAGKWKVIVRDIDG